ncbi:MAG: hypothetical protein ABJI60_09580 [Kangiellaceae bacterium]
MNYQEAFNRLLAEEGVESSTMMKTPCLRFKGEFLGMFFDKEDALIIKVSPQRVNQIIELELGREFNFTKKRFKEWVLIPSEQEEQFDRFLTEALNYAKGKQKQ